MSRGTSDTEFEPLTGSPPRVAEIAATAVRSAAALSATRADLVLLDRALLRHRSRAVDAARGAVVDLMAEADLCQEVLHTVGSALTQRAAALDEEQRDARRAVELRGQAQDRLRQAEADESEAWLSAASRPELTDATQRVWDARVRADRAREDIAAAEADWRRACDAKEAGSRQTAAQLGGLEHVRAVRMAAADGVHVPQFHASWQRGVELADLLDAVPPDGARADRTRARDALLDAVRAAGDDPALWTAFWDNATPAQLYVAFGLENPGPEAVTALRTGLTSWTAAATQAEQETMGQELVTDLGDSLLGLGVRSELLGELLGPHADAELPAALYTGAAEAVVERHGPAPYDGVDLHATAPAVLAVADGLSTYPDAALDHLAVADDVDAARRAHVWFGQAPPDGWPDGGAAVAGLLAVATVGAAAPSERTQIRAAGIVTRATPELVSDHGLLSGRVPVSDEAARRVALAYEPYIPSFEETRKDFTGRVRPSGTVVQADLDEFQLVQVIGTTSQTPRAADHWLAATDRYVDQVADEVRSMPVVDRTPRGDLSRATSGDTGFVSGATASPLLLEARTREEREAELAGAFLTGTSVATLPAGPVAGAAAAGTGVLLPHLLPDHVTGARELVLATEPVLRERYTTPLQEAAQDADIAAGYSAEKALERSVLLDTDSGDSTGRFGSSYNGAADLRRGTGETT